MEASVLNTLAIAAFSLLVAITGGVAYLTVMDWRDRRLQEKEKNETRPRPRR